MWNFVLANIFATLFTLIIVSCPDDICKLCNGADTANFYRQFFIMCLSTLSTYFKEKLL